MASPPVALEADRPRGLSKTVKIGLGLLFTLVGLALVSLLLPSAPESLGALFPLAGAGLLLLWVGGILMGIGSRS